MITLDSRRVIDITDIRISPILIWFGGIILSGVVSWAGWNTNEILKAKSAADDVKTAIVRLDTRFTSIDQRLERIEFLIMQQGLNNPSEGLRHGR